MSKLGTGKIPTNPKTGNAKSVSEADLDAVIILVDSVVPKDTGYNEIRENVAWSMGDGHTRNGAAFINYHGKT